MKGGRDSYVLLSHQFTAIFESLVTVLLKAKAFMTEETYLFTASHRTTGNGHSNSAGLVYQLTLYNELPLFKRGAISMMTTDPNIPHIVIQCNVNV